MATNQIYLFGNTAQIPEHAMDNATYFADPQRQIGNQPGSPAREDLVNTAARQSALMSTALAQFIVDIAIKDVVDDNDIPTKVSDLTLAINNLIDSKLADFTTLPVGMVSFFPSLTPPTGWLQMKGQALDKTTYSKLWDFASTSGNLTPTNLTDNTFGMFGSVDGNTFRLPTSEGYFLRVLNQNNTGNPDSGRSIGSRQLDSVKAHSHEAYFWGPSQGQGTTIPGGLNEPYDFPGQGDIFEKKRDTLSQNAATTENRVINLAWPIYIFAG